MFGENMKHTLTATWLSFLLCIGCSIRSGHIPSTWIWRDIPHTQYQIASPPDWCMDDDFTSSLALDGPTYAPGTIIASNGRNAGTTFDEWMAEARPMLTASNSHIIARSVHEVRVRDATGLQRATIAEIVSDCDMTNRITITCLEVRKTNWILVTTLAPSSGLSRRDRAVMERIVNSVSITSTQNQASQAER